MWARYGLQAMSIVKILLLALAALAAWYGWRLWQRHNKPEVDGESPASRVEADETEPCRVCGAYVPLGQAGHCGRPDCPYPKRA